MRTPSKSSLFLIFIAFAASIVNSGCGGVTAAAASSGNSRTNSASISVSPTSVSLQVGATQQFSATMAGLSSSTVTWTATGGTISSSGVYTAPSTAGSYTVTATSTADSTKTS